MANINVEKLKDTVEKIKIISSITKPLIDIAIEKLKPLIESVIEGKSIGRRGKRIKELEVTSEDFEDIIASIVSVNNSQQEQIDLIIERLEDLTKED
jgi:hypothetical protein